MSYALDRVAREMQADLDKYKIKVPVGGRLIVTDERVIKVDPYTDQRKCKRLLTELIKRAKAKAQAEQDAKQGRLL